MLDAKHLGCRGRPGTARGARPDWNLAAIDLQATRKCRSEVLRASRRARIFASPTGKSILPFASSDSCAGNTKTSPSLLRTASLVVLSTPICLREISISTRMRKAAIQAVSELSDCGCVKAPPSRQMTLMDSVAANQQYRSQQRRVCC